MKEPVIRMDSTQTPSKLHRWYDNLQSCNANAKNWIIQALLLKKKQYMKICYFVAMGA